MTIPFIFLALAFALLGNIFITVLTLTPWQLFQQMCPLVSPNSPQCFRAQQQQPQMQQQIPQQQYPYNYTYPQQQS
jgi:hypothetical protein